MGEGVDICHTLIFDPEITGSGGVYTAIVWMCKKQIGRRNITDEQRTVLIGEAYKAQKLSIGGDRGTDHDASGKFSASPQNEDLRKRQKTASKIAEQFGVGKSTVERAEQFLDGLNAAEEVVPGFKVLYLGVFSTCAASSQPIIQVFSAAFFRIITCIFEAF